jgi:hypothetical protein
MISGAHVIIYSKKPEKDRKFFKNVLKFPFVDAGEGWLIFALPPSEVAVHSYKINRSHELYLMCDDLAATMKELRHKKIKCSKEISAEWGAITFITLPGGSKLGIYQPRHPLAPRSDGSGKREL